jgi:uncharacterized protein (DUF697 family)
MTGLLKNCLREFIPRAESTVGGVIDAALSAIHKRQNGLRQVDGPGR